MKPFEPELNRYLQFVRIEKGLADNSIHSYRNDLERYLKFVHNQLNIKELAGVGHLHIEQFLEELSSLGLEVSSMARNVSSIRSFHEFALAEGFAEANPAELIELPRTAKKLPDVLSPEEIDSILQKPDRTRDDQ